VEITPKATLRRKLLGELRFCHLTSNYSSSEWDSTIQERLTDIQSEDEATVTIVHFIIFHAHRCSDFWIKCSEHFPELWGEVKLLLTGVSHNVRC